MQYEPSVVCVCALKSNSIDFEILFVKNPKRGPLYAIKEGFIYGNSDCVIVYPADDFINFNILDTMYKNLLKAAKLWLQVDL